MLRRLAILGVLLLSLSGFVPAVLACAAMAQQMDCCPPERPCEANHAPLWTDSTGLACCEAVSSHAPAAVTVSAEIKKYIQDLPPPKFSGAYPGCVASRGPPRVAQPDPVLLAFPADRQDIYLQTGRLRL